MAREIVFTDDLDGSHGAEPVKFGWDEVWWEIDLADTNRQALLEALQPYLDKAHPATVAGDRPAATRRTRATRAPSAERVDYTSPEHAGVPHRGRVSPEEAEYVRENLELVNRRLKANGQRTIDVNDRKLAERYGL